MSCNLTHPQFIQDDQNADDCPGLSNLNFDNDVDVGYIRECVINEVFDNVQRYDRYRLVLTGSTVPFIP